MATPSSVEVARALVVGAHPDDPELFAGGTVARWIDAGARVEFLLLTDGALGSSDPLREPREVARERAREAEEAAEFLGVARVRFAGYPDGDLASHASAVVEEVARAIREIDPDVLVGHDPWRAYEPHPDHRAAGFATCDGMIAAREHHALPSLRDAGLAPCRPREVWLMGTAAPDRYVDVSGTIDRKIEALAHHASQFAHIPGWGARVRGWNARIGAERGYAHAEAFHHLRVS